MNTDLLSALHGAQRDVRKYVDREFPVGTRVRPIGLGSLTNVRLTVIAMSDRARRELAADYIVVEWSDGSQMTVAVESCEALQGEDR